jgi:hypothetical protein
MPQSLWRPLTTTLALDLDACHDEGEFVGVLLAQRTAAEDRLMTLRMATERIGVTHRQDPVDYRVV